MSSDRSTALVVGIMFIVATGCYLVGQTVYAPIVGSADFLDLAHTQRTRVLAGVLTELIGVLAIPLIALLFYPVLRRHGHGSALAYIGIRMVEAVGLLLALVVAWASVPMSGEYGVSPAAAAAAWEVAGEALRFAGESAFLLSVGVIFPLGALLLNGLLWRSELVPRWLSGWGFFGAGLLLVGSLLDLFELFPVAPAVVLEVVLAGPIAVQEMALAAWLIAKGLNEARAAGGPMVTPTST